METGTASARVVHQEIAQALAIIDKANRHRLGAGRAIPNPKLKPLVLKAVPTASVRRIGSWQGRQPIAVTYECFIGDERISAKCCTGSHSTSQKAWVCLARYIAEGQGGLAL